ncbi:hypothetical protein ANN_12034 [Periplaneta americana]|uniref:Uncharacterized protein n=1 Tax=Periplaneta americana TaxID=6978 RepID=A0ABQ8T6P9_PERAM|nr:hypothetical protein ANN_12034 [Periplaneta americana]
MAGLCEGGNEPSGSLKAICNFEMATACETRTKQRAVIEFLFAERETIANIHRRLQHVYGDQAVDRVLPVIGLAECQ